MKESCQETYDYEGNTYPSKEAFIVTVKIYAKQQGFKFI